MKKYLVTGASGFVAYHFFEYLNSLQEDCEVLGVDVVMPSDMESYFFSNLRLRFVRLNLLDSAVLEASLLSFLPTHIIHLASFSSVAQSWKEPVNSFINNTNVFLNLVEIIRKNGIECRLLSVGSSEEYGNVPVECIPIKESLRLDPVSPYAIARVSQEMLSQCYVSSYKLDIVLTRSFNHIGPRQRDIFAIPSFIRQILEQTKINQNKNVKLYVGDVSLVRDFIDVRDVVRAYYLLLERGKTGELYNICSGKGHSIKEIIDMLCDLLAVRVDIETDKNRIRLGDNRVVIGDNSKICSLIGWEPAIPIMDTLRDLVTHWKEVLNV